MKNKTAQKSQQRNEGGKVKGKEKRRKKSIVISECRIENGFGEAKIKSVK